MAGLLPVLLAVLSLSSITSGVSASQGDVNPFFLGCVGRCNSTGCVGVPALRLAGTASDCNAFCEPVRSRGGAGGVHGAVLALSMWDCESDCKYRCMRVLSDHHAGSGKAPVKYYGKWPFKRVLGAQELLSSAFSLLNGAAHAHGLAKYMAILGRLKQAERSPYQYPYHPADLGAKGYPYRNLWLGYAMLNMALWICSAIFHARDTRVTEKLDYLSGNAVVAYSLWCALVRTSAWRERWKWTFAGSITAGLLACHWLYMLGIKFDYGWNMVASIIAGAAQAGVWVVWTFTAKPPFRRKLWLFWLGLHLSMAFELLDFAPVLGLLDAHAMWHAVTPPLVVLWYQVLIADVSWICKGSIALKGIDKII